MPYQDIDIEIIDLLKERLNEAKDSFDKFIWKMRLETYIDVVREEEYNKKHRRAD